MAQEIARQMKFIEGFEDTEPDISHKVSFRFCKELLQDKRCLELGCWTGRFIRQLNGICRSVVGVDINKDALEFAKRKNPKYGFVFGVAQKLPFKNNSFDIVTMFEVLEHLPCGSEAVSFREINRILKKDGYIILSTPNYHWLLNVCDIAHWLVGHRHYRIDKLREMLEEAGFRIYRINIIGGLLSVLFIPLSYFLKLVVRLDSARYKKISNYFDKHYDRQGFYNIYLAAQKV